MNHPLRMLHIGDTHWASEPIAPGIDSQARLNQLCDWIASIHQPIDALIHTGDWVHRGQLDCDSGNSTRTAWNRLAQIGIPILTAVGNHDNRSVLTQCFQQNLPAHWTVHYIHSKHPRLAYWLTLNPQTSPHECVLVLDARDSQDIDPRGRLCDDQIIALEQLLSDPNRNWTIFLHYPPIPLECDWIDRTMLLENGTRLHAIFASYAKQIRGVFFGHIHRPICCVKDSVLYASTGSATMHFPNMPSDSAAIMQSDPVAFANYISISDSGTLVKTQWTMLHPALP